MNLPVAAADVVADHFRRHLPLADYPTITRAGILYRMLVQEVWDTMPPGADLDALVEVVALAYGRPCGCKACTAAANEVWARLPEVKHASMELDAIQVGKPPVTP